MVPVFLLFLVLPQINLWVIKFASYCYCLLKVKYIVMPDQTGAVNNDYF